jgi:hypothetical protein
MARAAALTGSLVVHALALAGIAAMLGLGREPAGGGGARDAPSVSIEVASVVHASSAPVRPMAAPRGDPASAPRAPIRPTTARRALALATGPSASGIVETTVRMEPIDQDAAAGGGGLGAASGEGRSGGTGHGNGIGFGAGGGIATPVDTARLPTPEPPRRSLARPPRLRWPSREVEIGDRPLFVAHITVDDDGLVSRVRLVQGIGSLQDERAAGLIWLFRYDPALDDDGRAIAADIDQPFLVR